MYLLLYFTVVLDKVSQISLVTDIFRILRTTAMRISSHFTRVAEINSTSFCGTDCGDATAAVDISTTFQEADDALFRTVLSNRSHVLYTLSLIHI